MFPIDPRNAVQRTQGSAARPAASGGPRFTLPTQGGTEAARMQPGSATLGLDALVAMQANEDATERRQRRVRRGHELLDGLDRLKAALLAGAVPIHQLAQLKTQLDQRRETSDDPRLEELIGHIELRVAVEIAKLGR